MNQKLKEKILESVSAVLPITGIVLLLSILLVPVNLRSEERRVGKECRL